MCGRMRRYEHVYRERAWSIESSVFSGSKVSLQSLLMQSPWEPISVPLQYRSLVGTRTLGHTLAFFLTHTQYSIHSFLQSGFCSQSNRRPTRNKLPKGFIEEEREQKELSSTTFVFLAGNKIAALCYILYTEMCLWKDHVFSFSSYFS